MTAIHALSGQELANAYNEAPAHTPIERIKQVLPRNLPVTLIGSHGAEPGSELGPEDLDYLERIEQQLHRIATDGAYVEAKPFQRVLHVAKVADPARAEAFAAWLARIAPREGLRPGSLRIASADASFRRYLRLDAEDGATRIVMDAPPAQENSAPFVHVAGLMQAAGLPAPPDATPGNTE